MPIVAVTGGIACGKSHCVKSFQDFNESGTTRVFSCDKEVSNLLTEQEIIGRLSRCVGESVVEGEGTINRAFLREKVFRDSAVRKEVEDIIHPLVLEKAKEFLTNFESDDLILVEVPLLYEVDFPVPRDFDLVIGCSTQTQLLRLIDIRGIDEVLSKQILSIQVPIQEKVDRAHFVIWNDGCFEAFNHQVQAISDTILSNSIGL